MHDRRTLSYNRIMLDHANATEALKWAALVFGAGFIGFFGKSLARAVVSVFQKKKEDSPRALISSGDPASSYKLLPGAAHGPKETESRRAKDEEKIAKKALKAKKKAAKKQGKAEEKA